ncbi:hypothetical protein MMC20_008094 [Loxospora ochrophaea]|nr:hypothetical protein [Loxospora ochrophaea]
MCSLSSSLSIILAINTVVTLAGVILIPPSESERFSTSQSSLSSPSLTKRGACSSRVSDAGRPIIQASHGGTFVTSRCRPDLSPRTYEIVYTLPESPGFRFERGRCADDEICSGANIYGWKDNIDVAICIPDPDYYKLLHLRAGQVNAEPCATIGAQQGAGAGAGAGQNQQAAVGISLTGENGQTDPQTAAFLQIEAQRETELFGATTYTTLPGGLHACEQCSSVGIYPLPEGTQRLHASYELAGSSGARMYWTEFTM